MNIEMITRTLSRSPYAHIEDMSRWLTFTPAEQQRFSAEWDNLVRDENFRQYTHRERRILRYRSADRDVTRLEIIRESHFKPMVTYNVDYKQGTNKLSYAKEKFIKNPLLQQIIKIDHAVLYAAAAQPKAITMDIHQFRVKACEGVISPTTSGIHQDGVDWIFMHFIRKHNVRPVISEIFRHQGEDSLLFRKEMDQFMETLIVNDTQCWHRASPVEQLDNKQPAWRDLLLVTCRCLPQGEPV